jgi:Flp pilus assembly protein TadG
VIVVAALAMAGLLGVCALVLDGAMVAEQRRQIQNGVDAAALAAAVHLPDDTARATAAAEEYLEAGPCW